MAAYYLDSSTAVKLYVQETGTRWLRFRLVEVTPGITEAAMDLAQSYGLRGYDSVHLAAASAIQRGLLLMQLPSLVFISADNDQLQAALADGLQTDNPNTHP